uniref:Uncharacterized protein n=1 Tax=Avena sativa TaxID=4498 RepID=A0ACD6AGH7_AVESA
MDMDMEEEHTTTTLVQRHPLLLCFLFFLGFLYTFLYPIFVFLLASSPVLLLTAFLLGIVLLHSVPQHEHDHHHHHHVHKKITRPPQSQTTTLTVPAPARRRPSPSTSSSSDSDQDNPPAASLAMSTATSLGSFPDATGDDDSSEDSDLDNTQAENHHHQRSKDLLVRGVAWTADDMKSIENIGSLELERNATVEKVMSERLNSPRHPPPQQHRRGHVAAWKKSNPFDLDDEDFPGSAPSMPSPNPFFDDEDDILPLHHAPQPGPGPGAAAQAQAQQKNAMLFRRHESFTVGAPHASDFRPSRFRPYFAIDDKMQQQQGQPVAVPGGGGGKISPSSSSSSSSSFSAGANAYTSVSAHNKQEEEAAEQEKALAEAEAAAILEAKTDDHPPEMFVVRPREVVALDVELISDSSDEDISLPEPMMKVQEQQQQQHVVVAAAVPGQDDEDDEGESFEVESITKQVAAAAEGKGKQLDPAVYGDYNPSAGTGTGTGTGTVEEKKALPPLAPPSMAQIKLASMRRVFSEEDADEPMAAPSGLEDTTTLPKEEQDMFPLPPPPESAAAAGAAPPLASAAKKGVGKSVKYKPPSKKAVMGFFQGKGKA